MKAKDYNIKRFYYEHKLNYDIALREIKNGRKFSHWIWYVFPQLKVLGSSDRAIYYGIENAEEAKAYYDDPYLGEKFREICSALLECKSDDALEIMGYPDNFKLQASMTLFYIATEDELFKKALDKFFDGKQHPQTVGCLYILG